MTANVTARIRDLTDHARQNEPRLAAFALRTLAVRGKHPDREDVEDVLSDAYLTAATKLRNDPGLRIRNLGAWFRRIVFFQCLRRSARWRFEGRRDVLRDLEFQGEAIEIVSEAASHEDPTVKIFVWELLGRLEERERAVLELTAEGYRAAEIAARLETTEQNVRQIRSRAAKALRERYYRENG